MFRQKSAPIKTKPKRNKKMQRNQLSSEVQKVKRMHLEKTEFGRCGNMIRTLRTYHPAAENRYSPVNVVIYTIYGGGVEEREGGKGREQGSRIRRLGGSRQQKIRTRQHIPDGIVSAGFQTPSPAF